MNMNAYRGIQALLSFLSDALITLGEATARDKAEQQVARISGRPGFCLGIRQRDSGNRPEERFT
jgi:hypothetical protein